MTLRDQLIRDEGLVLKVYRDSVGKLTIGVGRNLEDKGLSRAEALHLLDNDIADFTSALYAALPWAKQLDAPRQAVLVGMAFNMGVVGLLGFKNTLAAVKDGRWDEAADHMLESKWAKQVGARANRLARQMRQGEWV